MPLTRGEAVGYDADLMVFEFTMRNGEQIVPTLPTSDCGSLKHFLVANGRRDNTGTGKER